jgi:hypothetical protein
VATELGIIWKPYLSTQYFRRLVLSSHDVPEYVVKQSHPSPSTNPYFESSITFFLESFRVLGLIDFMTCAVRQTQVGVEKREDK